MTMLLAVKMLLLALMAISITGQHAGIHTASKAPAAPLDSCVRNPLQQNCTGFEYPLENAAADINKLCSAMHFMAACSVAKACNASGAGPADPTGPEAAQVSKNNPNVCNPFNQVATVCRLDTGMGRMMGCTNYNTMCVEGSKVPQCSSMPGLKNLPTSEVVNKQVRSICEEMTMDGCERCMPSWQAGRTWADCDLLDTYGLLCYAMPEMGQCGEWHAMCKADSSLVFCHGADGSGGSSGSGGASTGGPVMKMYFFEEMPFYLLFKSWTPRTNTDLTAAWFAIFALGLFYELLQMLYGKFEARSWARINGAAAAAANLPSGTDLEHGKPIAEGAGDVTAAAGADIDAAACRACCSGSSAANHNHNSSSNGMAHHHMTTVMGTPAAAKSSHSSSSGGGGKACCSGGGSSKKRAPGCFGSYFQPQLVMMDVIRGVARFVLAGLAYLLMLAAMSYHVAIFFAVIAGVGVGSMLFGRWRFSSGTPEGYSHCGCGSS